MTFVSVGLLTSFFTSFCSFWIAFVGCACVAVLCIEEIILKVLAQRLRHYSIMALELSGRHLRQNRWRVCASRKGTLQKSLKGISKLVSERVPKSQKSKIYVAKGHNFQKFRARFGKKSTINLWKLTKIKGKVPLRVPKISNVSQRVYFRFSAWTHTRHPVDLLPSGDEYG